MGKGPLISVIIVSNRPYWWQEVYDNIMHHTGGVNIEVVFVSPCDLEIFFPSNVRHIKIGNIKVPQCCEIGIREAQGDMLLFIADDAKYHNGGISDMYHRYLVLCEELGHDKVVVIPGLKVGRSVSTLRYGKIRHAPIASLNSALIDRKLLLEIGGIDTRFVGVYWDCDLAMRLHEIDVHFEKYNDVFVIEGYHKEVSNPYLLHRICKPHDRSILDNFWTRFTKEPELELPEDAYAYMKDCRWVITKKRQKSVIPFSDNDILISSQGVREFGGLKWD